MTLETTQVDANTRQTRLWCPCGEEFVETLVRKQVRAIACKDDGRSTVVVGEIWTPI